MLKIENCIPAFQYLLTTDGWECIYTLNINSKVLIIKDNKFFYENPKIHSLFSYKGIITEFSIVDNSVDDHSKDVESKFYFKTYKDTLRTYLKELDFIKENVLWEGDLCCISFDTKVQLPVSNGLDYVIINL